MDIKVYETYEQFQKNEPAYEKQADVTEEGDFFFLKVQDNALAPDLEEGTLALFKKQRKALSGQIILATTKNEMKIRTLSYEKDSLWLKSNDNDNYPSEYYNGISISRVKIHAVLVK